jgi:L-aspartate oxidase
MIPRYMVDFDPSQLPCHDVDVVVVGSGVAGLSTALRAARAFKVALITKTSLTLTATRFAQGGVASALASDDSPKFHFEDTIKAGKGLCEEDSVWVLVREGPARVRELIDEVGARFDTKNGALDLTTEGGHSMARVAHAGGDATGSEIESSLSRRLIHNKRLRVFEHYYAIDVLTVNGRCLGIVGMDIETGTLSWFRAPAVVLAVGGMGELYADTTNPDICTGDGVGLALRAGAEIADVEFLQFHPTTLHISETPRWLISEALRGEGAILLDHAGKRIMEGVHPLKDLAPRDTVVNEMVRVMKASGEDHLLLDATRIPAEKLRKRFPTIYQHCLDAGIDITEDPIPVSPAAHYMSGGAITDLRGRTKVRGLYACGETACTGVHGANRLASNSLLEGLVFSHRIMDDLMSQVPAGRYELENLFPMRYKFERSEALADTELLRRFLKQLMLDCVGFRRTRAGLNEAEESIRKNLEVLQAEYRDRAGFELQNMISLASLMTRAASLREESRGCHFRVDFPGQDEFWRKHIVFQIHEGRVSYSLREMGRLHDASYDWSPARVGEGN